MSVISGFLINMTVIPLSVAKIMGCMITWKVHILDAYLDNFREKMEVYSEDKINASVSTRIYWTLSVTTKDNVMKTHPFIFVNDRCLRISVLLAPEV